MNRLLEILLGLERGFLSRQGDFSLTFDPVWPWKESIGSVSWNLLLVALAIALVVFIYRREGKARWSRLLLGGLRLSLLLLVIALLNRPNLTLTQSRTEPSVLAVLVDDSISMKLEDVVLSDGQSPISRLDAARTLLSGADRQLLTDLSAVHQLRFYRFNRDAQALGSDAASAAAALAALRPEGGQTLLTESVKTVAGDLQGQRLAGVLVLSDGRQTDTAAAGDVAALKDLGVKVFTVPIGAEQGLKNVEIDTVGVLDSVFVGDIVNFRVNLRGVGLEAGQKLTLRLKHPDGAPVIEAGRPVEQIITWSGQPQQIVEMQYVPAYVGEHDFIVAIDSLGGEIDEQDNSRQLSLAVMDANIRVLYVDGYPRWEYRYLRQELIRDKTIECSLLLMSADTAFFQEGDRPLTRFPETIEELMEYDVVLFGDVHERQFTDDQLQLVNQFVGERGGGFGMVAGPQFSPSKYRGTAIEPLLPVDITAVQSEAFGGSGGGTLAQGWRPVITEEGKEGSIFRFYRDPAVNQKFLLEGIQPLFWFSRNIVAKPGVAQVLAQHPTQTGPDGRPAPLLVVGRFGTGRTLFSAFDDSWRWRYYTGEQVFSSYWVQSLRYLARGRKLGERKITLLPERPLYPLGTTARLSVRVLDPNLVRQLPDALSVQLTDSAGQTLRDVQLVRRAGSGDLYTGSFTADRVGRYTLRLPSVAGGVAAASSPIEFTIPRLELTEPRVDRAVLESLSRETGGVSVDYAVAREALPGLIPSAERAIPLLSDQSLWDAPLVFVLFVLLITTEWVMRKLQGLV